jgi:hypothetical protein
MRLAVHLTANSANCDGTSIYNNPVQDNSAIAESLEEKNIFL